MPLLTSTRYRQDIVKTKPIKRTEQKRANRSSRAFAVHTRKIPENTRVGSIAVQSCGRKGVLCKCKTACLDSAEGKHGLVYSKLLLYICSTFRVHIDAITMVTLRSVL